MCVCVYIPKQALFLPSNQPLILIFTIVFIIVRVLVISIERWLSRSSVYYLNGKNH